MKLEVTYPDPERATVDLLFTLVAGATVGVGVPEGWTVQSPPHLEVAWDGTPLMDHPVAAYPTIRIVARAGTTTEAKQLAWEAHGMLTAHLGDEVISGIRPLTGVLPARDPDTHAELASFTVRVTVRSQPLV